MADIIDQAQDLAEHQLAQALAAVPKPTGESAFYCIDCDEVIPHQRRAAVRGVRRCAPCQGEYESQKKRGLVCN